MCASWNSFFLGIYVCLTYSTPPLAWTLLILEMHTCQLHFRPDLRCPHLSRELSAEFNSFLFYFWILYAFPCTCDSGASLKRICSWTFQSRHRTYEDEFFGGRPWCGRLAAGCECSTWQHPWSQSTPYTENGAGVLFSFLLFDPLASLQSILMMTPSSRGHPRNRSQMQQGLGNFVTSLRSIESL